MQRSRREGLVSKDTLIAVGLAVCLGVLVWGVFQALGGTSAARHAPAQAPARQEPRERARPNLDPEPIAKLARAGSNSPV